MAKDPLYGFNARDIQRIQKAVRFVEDNATTFRTYRRIRGQQAGGIPPLMCEDEEEES